MGQSRHPVERILYLDADVLVGRDLKEIWRIDMGGRPIGAVRDIGYPIGHPGLPEINRGHIYFNAGVLLVNLSLIRRRLPEMKNALATLKETAYRDQDFLNAFFSDDMSSISCGMLAALAHTLHGRMMTATTHGHRD